MREIYDAESGCVIGMVQESIPTSGLKAKEDMIADTGIDLLDFMEYSMKQISTGFGFPVDMFPIPEESKPIETKKHPLAEKESKTKQQNKRLITFDENP